MTTQVRDQKLNVVDVMRLPPSQEGAPSWVNGIVEGRVEQAEVRSGQKGPYVTMTLADLQEPGHKLGVTVWGGRVPPSVGNIVSISGKGIRRTEYNGQAQMSANLANVSIDQRMGEGMTQPSEGMEPETSYKPPAFPGPMVCASVKTAAKLLSGICPRDYEYYDSPQFARELHTLASHFIRVQKYLEGGHLADKPGEHVPMGVPPELEPYQKGGQTTGDREAELAQAVEDQANHESNFNLEEESEEPF